MPEYDPVLLEIMNSLLSAVAEEMGAALGRTAYSPNIKERRDFSCAVFDAQAAMVARPPTSPCIWAPCPCRSRPRSHRFPNLAEGDIVVLNDPYAGGSHLPDITMVSPVFERPARPGCSAMSLSRARTTPTWAASRRAPCRWRRSCYQEGLIIPPVLLQRAGELDEGVLDMITRQQPHARGAPRRPDRADLGAAARRPAAAGTGGALRAARCWRSTWRICRITRSGRCWRCSRPCPRGRFEFADMVDDDGFGDARYRYSCSD